MPAGLAGEYVVFVPGMDFEVGMRHYMLRPEAIESMFVLWRVTGDLRYQDWAWRMFLSFEKHCKVSDCVEL